MFIKNGAEIAIPYIWEVSVCALQRVMTDVWRLCGQQERKKKYIIRKKGEVRVVLTTIDLGCAVAPAGRRIRQRKHKKKEGNNWKAG